MPLSSEDGGQKHLVAAEAAHAPLDVHQPERAEEDAAPQSRRRAGTAPDAAPPAERLQLAELLAGQQSSLCAMPPTFERLPVR